jgi:hypothetical protein
VSEGRARILGTAVKENGLAARVELLSCLRSVLSTVLIKATLRALNHQTFHAYSPNMSAFKLTDTWHADVYPAVRDAPDAPARGATHELASDRPERCAQGFREGQERPHHGRRARDWKGAAPCDSCHAHTYNHAQAVAHAFGLAGAATIVITARSQGDLNATRAGILGQAHGASPPTVLTHITDVTSNESVERLFKMLDDAGILPDVLVNNAGILMPSANLHEADPAE